MPFVKKIQDTLEGPKENYSIEQKPQYRIAVMGAHQGGKTTLINRVLYGIIPRAEAGLVEETLHMKYDTDNSDLQFLDTKKMSDASICNADAFLLVYDIGDWSSFQVVADLQEKIKQLRKRAKILVVGNSKKDELDERISLTTQELVCTIDWGLPFVCVSAEQNINIEYLYYTIIKKLILAAQKCPEEVKKEVKIRGLCGFCNPQTRFAGIRILTLAPKSNCPAGRTQLPSFPKQNVASVVK